MATEHGPQHTPGEDRNDREMYLISLYQRLNEGNFDSFTPQDVATLLIALRTQMYFDGTDPPEPGAKFDPDMTDPNVWDE